MSDDGLEAAFKRAAEIAKAVPERFQEAAFNRALDSLLGDASGVDRHESAPAKKRKSGKGKSNKGGTESGIGEQKKKKRANSSGPKTLLLELKVGGYFASKRTISEIRDHIEKKRGRKLTVQDLSPALLSLVRDQELDRDKNSDGQYEYTAT
jgi:hypothetical protein